MQEKDRVNAAEGGRGTFQKRERRVRGATMWKPGVPAPIACATAMPCLYMAMPLGDLPSYR